MLWLLQPTKASAWSRESEGRKGMQQCHSLPLQGMAYREWAWSNMPAVVTLNVLHSRLFLGRRGDYLAHASHSFSDSVETHLQLLHDSIVPSHHQNISTFHKLLFKLVLYQTQISVLLSYSVQRNAIWCNTEKSVQTASSLPRLTLNSYPQACLLSQCPSLSTM